MVFCLRFYFHNHLYPHQSWAQLSHGNLAVVHYASPFAEGATPPRAPQGYLFAALAPREERMMGLKEFEMEAFI